jgi:hypothetical protein
MVRLRDGLPEFIPPAWIDPNAAYLSGAPKDVNFRWPIVQAFPVDDPLDFLVADLSSLDHTRIAAVSAFPELPFLDLSEGLPDRPLKMMRGKTRRAEDLAADDPDTPGEG